MVLRTASAGMLHQIARLSLAALFVCLPISGQCQGVAQPPAAQQSELDAINKQAEAAYGKGDTELAAKLWQDALEKATTRKDNAHVKRFLERLASLYENLDQRRKAQ